MTERGVVWCGYSLVSNTPMLRSSNSLLMDSAPRFEQFSTHHFIIWWVWRKKKREHEENGGRPQEAISVIFWNHADANEIRAKYGGSTSEGHHLEAGSNDPLCGVRLTSLESGGHEQNVISVFRRQPNCSTSLLGTGCAPMTVDDCEKLVNSSFGTCK